MYVVSMENAVKLGKLYDKEEVMVVVHAPVDLGFGLKYTRR